MLPILFHRRVDRPWGARTADALVDRQFIADRVELMLHDNNEAEKLHNKDPKSYPMQYYPVSTMGVVICDWGVDLLFCAWWHSPRYGTPRAG